MRDRYTCQYCHRTLPSGELTLDHVVPRSRAGESAWENLVACCHVCNNRKGSRTPEEAGMKLVRQPRPFSLHTSRHLIRMLGRATPSGASTCSTEEGEACLALQGCGVGAGHARPEAALPERRGCSRHFQRVGQMPLGVIAGIDAHHDLRHRTVQHAEVGLGVQTDPEGPHQ